MKKLSLLLFAWLAVWNLAACGDDSDALPNGYIETTEDGASTFVFEGYADASQGFNVLQPDGFDKGFYILDKKFAGDAYLFASGLAGRLSDMGELPADGNWQAEMPVAEGQNYWIRYKGLTAYTFLKLRVAYVQGNNVGVEYAVAGSQDRDLSENENANPVTSDDASAASYEMPALNGANLFVSHYVDVEGNPVLNYSLEWDNAKRHAAWVAFSFDALTCQDNVTRTDEWAIDPSLPEGMSPDEDNHRGDGFDKGHLVASEDRVYDLEANKQTFYYTNLSPQLNAFNGGFWQTLESRVQSWGRACANGTYDKVYVAKGGTLNDLLLDFRGAPVSGGTPTTDADGFTIHGLACPSHYFMAILAEKGDTYHAIAFYVEHRADLPEKPSADDLKACAISVDELEELTGIDFFCNLPDVMEDEVEHACVLNDWTW